MEYVDQARDLVMHAATTVDAKWASIFGPIHPLSADFPLMRPSTAASFGLAYLAFVALVPPLFKAVGFSIKLKPVMRLYNVFMVALSAYMCGMSILLARQSNDTVWCVPLASGEAGRRMATLTWIFTYSKVIEFLDSVFMVFEGRWRQLSFLHVYHHLSILSYWFAILWIAPGSDAYFSLAGNSFIHVLMYSYYLLASFNITPWWKYYITYCQILQFVSFAGQSLYVGYHKTEAVCDFPDVLSRGLLWYMLTLIVLFLNFLVKNKGKAKVRSGAAGAKKRA
ncbi:hypothetical protein BU14_0197s0017 [Porphyra umbilicalis]|uniref:Elongation of fatty acids protein n=1 Tax=Porphyra umbilicalis TaxID=2786 RepID=A0A1X6P5Y8_PORUM|nr:hypothetical protein BU14_0197s0017 [Porphyra umbilicalis]|eukprot:OSX76321.1 hypothetical protein BU14_0197s0017 [Porphyra umbilicalis]